MNIEISTRAAFTFRNLLKEEIERTENKLYNGYYSDKDRKILTSNKDFLNKHYYSLLSKIEKINYEKTTV